MVCVEAGGMLGSFDGDIERSGLLRVVIWRGGGTRG